MDTAGQERFRSIPQAYYRRADGIVIVFDCTQRESFENVRRWFKDINEIVRKGDPVPPMVLFGNKTDMKEIRDVTQGEGNELAVELGMSYAEGCQDWRGGRECF